MTNSDYLIVMIRGQNENTNKPSVPCDVCCSFCDKISRPGSVAEEGHIMGANEHQRIQNSMVYHYFRMQHSQRMRYNFVDAQVCLGRYLSRRKKKLMSDVMVVGRHHATRRRSQRLGYRRHPRQRLIKSWRSCFQEWRRL